MRRTSVLLADDHTIVCEGLKKILEPEFEVIACVKDGHALVKTAAELKPDLVLVDDKFSSPIRIPDPLTVAGTSSRASPWLCSGALRSFLFGTGAERLGRSSGPHELLRRGVVHIKNKRTNVHG